MSADVIHARLSALREVADGLAAYGRGLEGAIVSARRDINRAGAEFEIAVVNRQRALREAMRRTEAARAALAACRESCGGLQRELSLAQGAEEQARRQLERAKGAKARFERAAADLLATLGAIGEPASQAIPAGREFVREYAEILTGYLKTGV